MDGLCQETLDAIHALPNYRLGYVPRQPRVAFLEDLYGRFLFSALYLVGGVAALGAHVLQSPDSGVPLVGASGAIACVMGAFLIRLAAARIQFLVMPLPILPFIRFTMFLPAFVVLPLWATTQWVYAHVAKDAGIAWWAHLGGFGFGMLAAIAIRLTGIERHWIHPAIEKQTTLTQHTAIEDALEARVNGDLPRARQAIQAALAAHPENPDALLESLEIAFSEEDPAEISRAATRLLEVLSRQGEDELASQLVYDDRLRQLKLSTRYRVAAGAFLEKLGDLRQALESYQRAVEAGPRDPVALRALNRRAQILFQGGDLRQARIACEQALAHPGCSELLRPPFEELLARLPAPAAKPKSTDDDPPEWER